VVDELREKGVTSILFESEHGWVAQETEIGAFPSSDEYSKFLAGYVWRHV
jgi:hypothetical protein